VNGAAGATHEGIRRQNLAALVRILHRDGASTRSELASVTGLNRSTVGTLSVELARLDVVTEQQGMSAGVGRPSILVTPSSGRVATLAVDIRVGAVVVALVGFGGTVLHRRELRFSATGALSPSKVVDRAARLCRTVLASHAGPCVGIGVGVPGLVHDDEDAVREAPNLGWVDVPLGAMLRARLDTDIPIRVSNDADLGALAEYTRGAARGYAHAIYLAGQVGVGGGVIIDGRLLTGSSGYGGEVGHMQVNPRGRECRCGGRGCWETEVGEDALLAAAGRAGQGLGADDVVRLAEAGDRQAQLALRQVARWLAVGVVNLVNSFSPEVVVFGGALRDVLPAATGPISRAVAGCLVGRHQPVRLAAPQLGGDSTLIGASEMAFEPLLADPIGVLGGVRA
jgi:predicted NBD/HSP70 family sugar kinase